MVYYIIYRGHDEHIRPIVVKDTAGEVAIFMLGRCVDSYDIIKSADKLLVNPSYDVLEMTKQLEAL